MTNADFFLNLSAQVSFSLEKLLVFLRDSSSPDDLYSDILTFKVKFDEYRSGFLSNYLNSVCKSDSDKECELSQSDKIDSADNGHD